MALTGCSQVTATIGADTIRVIVPTGFTSGPCVMYTHGMGDSNNGLNHPSVETTVQAWIDAGYLSCSSDATGDAWGNAAAITAYKALIDYVLANYTTTRWALYSGSMGGMAGLLMLADGYLGSRIAGWVGIFPVCSLAAEYSIFQSSIDTAYGIPGGGTYAAQTAGRDPLLLGASAYPRIRFLFFHSPDDVTVPKTSNTDAFAAILNAAGTFPEVTVTTTTGVHGDMSNFQPSVVSAFLTRAFAAGRFASVFAGVVR